MKNFILICWFSLILSYDCTAQQNTTESVYTEAMKYLRTDKKIKEEVLKHFCGNKYRKMIISRKYFKANYFSFRLYETVFDTSFFHINCYKDTLLKYCKENNVIYNGKMLVNKEIDLKNISKFNDKDTLSPFLVVFSNLYKNFLYVSVFLKNYHNKIDFYYSNRLEILFILDENKKIKKIFFSSIVIN